MRGLVEVIPFQPHCRLAHKNLLLPRVADRARAGVGLRVGGKLAVEPGEH